MLKVPELLAPAGTHEQLEAALLYGADAVYLGGGELSLRAGRPFQGEALTRALALCRGAGVKVYYCLNAFPRQNQWRQVEAALEVLGQARPDALIIADAGVLHAARRQCPHIPVHLSTQANTGNAASAAFWADQGVTRVNLARELPLTQIRAIRQSLRHSHPALAVECFVHGALCLALSGQCLLSAWLQDRPANEGRCTQPCRYKYRKMRGAPSLHGAMDVPESVVVEEALRPHTPLWEVTQHRPDGTGECGDQGDFAAIWSPEDICLIRFLPWFTRTGVDSLKIEGRMRTGGYVAHAVDVYRTALDALRLGVPAERTKGEAELRATATRALSTGFFLPRRQCRPSAGALARTAAALPPVGVAHALPLLARVEEQVRPQSWKCSVRGRWEATRPVSLVLPHMRRPVLQPEDYYLENAKGEKVSTVHSGTTAVLHCQNGQDWGLVAGVYVRACA
ncbi:MAG: peptidase U32 family protein [Desulfovibrionaceae bacterium]